MNETMLTVLSILGALVMFALLYVLGFGVLPFLKTLTLATEEKRELVKKEINSLDARLASDSNPMSRAIHSIASELDFEPEQSAVINMTEIINNGMKMVFKILRETPDTLSEQEVANAADKVAGVISRLTDAIPDNALNFPDMRVSAPKPVIPTYPPSADNSQVFGG